MRYLQDQHQQQRQPEPDGQRTARQRKEHVRTARAFQRNQIGCHEARRRRNRQAQVPPLAAVWVHHPEARQPRRPGHHKQERQDQAPERHAAKPARLEEIQQHRRGNTETGNVHKGIQLRPETRLRPQQPGQRPVQPIQNQRHQNQLRRQQETAGPSRQNTPHPAHRAAKVQMQGMAFLIATRITLPPASAAPPP